MSCVQGFSCVRPQQRARPCISVRCRTKVDSWKDYGAPDDYGSPKSQVPLQYAHENGCYGSIPRPKPAVAHHRAISRVKGPTSYASPAPYQVPSLGLDNYGIDDYGTPRGPGDGSGGGSGGSGGSSSSGGSSGPGNFLTLLFGVLVMVGGVMGYLKKGSKMSLIAGGAVGLALLMAGSLMGNPATAKIGCRMACLVSIALAAAMGKRYMKSKAFMPAGAVASAATLHSLIFIFSGAVF